MQNNLSIIIPAYNESASIVRVIENLHHELLDLGIEDYEIIVVNDGSTDQTRKILEGRNDIKLINHPYNKGMGAGMKTGTRNAMKTWVLFFDADGQHKSKYIKEFLKYTDEYELIVGDRSEGKYVRPTIRKPGLWLLRKVANYLVDYKIPDLNCGLRMVKRDVLMKYLHLMPDGFSMSTTSTMAFLKDKKNVKFVPIEVDKRHKNSKSIVRPSDAVKTLMLMFRLIMLFSPLRIFFPTSLMLFFIGFVFLIFDLCQANITDITVLLIVTSMLIFFFGLIADQMAALRREMGIKK